MNDDLVSAHVVQDDEDYEELQEQLWQRDEEPAEQMSEEEQ
jgi:hypothetical protein